MPALSIEADDRLIPDPVVARRYSKSGRTIMRWDSDPHLGFPAPVVIRGRKYRRESELIAWERQLAANRT